MSKAYFLTDKDGNKIYPYSHADATYDKNGEKVGDILDELETHANSAHAPSDAEVNQNAFSNIVVGSTTISADSKTDSLTLVAGSNVTLTPDATNDKVTIAATDTVYTHPTTAGNKHIPSGGAAGQILKYSASGTAVWGTVESIATTEPTTQSNGDHWLLEY